MTSTAPDLLLTGSVVTDGRVVADGALVVADGRIAYAGARAGVPANLAGAAEPEGWEPGRTLLPGLVDLHCHGGAGGEMGPDPSGAARAVAHHHAHGTTSVVGSLVSAPGDLMVAGTRVLADLAAQGDLAGIHLEGPFLSVARCGAQNPAALVDPDPRLLDALLEAADGHLAHVTWAPERHGGESVPSALARGGALAALGHTDTDHAGAARALASALDVAPRGGRPLVTHLFNGMPPLQSRAPGPAGAAIAAAARGEAVVEVIADGVHLDGGTVRMLYDTVGPHGMALVSDAMAASGMPGGDYTLGGLRVRVEDGAARLVEGGSIAGGVTVLLDQVRRVVRELGVPLADAVTMAATTPARALALPGVGVLAAGAEADVLVVDADLALRGVLRRGRWL